MPDPKKPLYDSTRADTPAAAAARPSQNPYGATMADADTRPSGAGKTPIASNYHIITLIGEGGMGKVFLAFDANVNRHVALKRVSPEHVGNERLYQRFLTEARASGKLDHFHIVRVFQLSSDAEGPFIAMEYVPGPNRARPKGWPQDAPNPPLDLDEFIRTNGKLGVPAAVRIARKLLSAIGYAHKNQIIHRDIKPANVLLTDSGEPKLADFGLARQIDLRDEGRTLAGAALLSIGYGAPEQENDASSADHRADLYAVGATLWYLLTAQNPRFFREAEVPLPLRAIVVKALEKDREKRFQSAQEFDAALEKLAGAPASHAPASTSTERGRCPKCQHVHFTDAQGFTSIKFCEQCGHSLQEACLKCTQNNGLWSKFCGSCGIDIAANNAATIAGCRAEIKAIETQVKEGRYLDALITLDRFARYAHPKLECIATEAKAIQPRIQNLFRAAQADCEEKIQTAQRLLSNYHYQRAVDLLHTVPRPLWTEPLQAVLRKAEAALEEMQQLRRAIKSFLDVPLYERTMGTDELNATFQALGRLNVSQHRELIGRLARMTVLIPSDPYYQQLTALANKSAHREMEQSWENAQNDNSVEAYESFLRTYPDSPRLLEATDLLSAALRVAVFKYPTRTDYRRRYLELRTAAQASEDRARSYLFVLAMSVALGILGAAVAGALFALFAGLFAMMSSSGSGANYAALAGAIGGAVGGLAIVLRITRG